MARSPRHDVTVAQEKSVLTYISARCRLNRSKQLGLIDYLTNKRIGGQKTSRTLKAIHRWKPLHELTGRRFNCLHTTLIAGARSLLQRNAEIKQ